MSTISHSFKQAGYYRIWISSQIKRFIGQGVWEWRGASMSFLSRWTTLPESPHAHQPRSSLNHLFLGFMEALLQRHAWLHHWALVTISTSSSLFFLEIRGWDWTFHFSIQGWFPWQLASIHRWFPDAILLPENWLDLLVDDKPKDTTKSKRRRRKDLLLVATKDNTWDLS